MYVVVPTENASWWTEGSNLSTTMDIYCPQQWKYEPHESRGRTSGDNTIKNGYPQDE